jgi:serine/threonine protein kinase
MAGRQVAVKAVRNTYGSFERERKMLVRLARVDQQTPHLSRLLATFETTSAHNLYHGAQFYFMFPKAEYNLWEFWKNNPPPAHDNCHPDTGRLARWVAKQCLGLAQALHGIHEHKPGKDDDDPDSRNNGFHGDLKPQNILYVTDWAGYDEPFGLLQIADFGLSNFYGSISIENVQDRRAPHYTNPPEAATLLRASKPLDIWAIGCIFLEFLTWLTQGYQGLRKFRHERKKKEDASPFTPDYAFYQVREVAVNEPHGSTTVFSVSEKVLEVSQLPFAGFD